MKFETETLDQRDTVTHIACVSLNKTCLWDEAEIIREKTQYAAFHVIGYTGISNALSVDPDIVIVSLDLVYGNGGTIAEFISMVEKVASYIIPMNRRLRLAAYVDKSTTAKQIDELRANNFVGIVRSSEIAGSEVMLNDVLELMTLRSYWPEEIISKPITIDPPLLAPPTTFHTSSDKVNIVYFRNDYPNSVKCKTIINDELDVVWINVPMWGELTAALEHGNEYVAVHIDMIENTETNASEFVDTMNTIVKLIPNSNPLKVGVIIKKDTNVKIISELKNAGIQGILLDIDYYPVDEMMLAMQEFLAGNSYWPKHIINALPGNTVKEPQSSEIKLTARQQQVCDLVCNRGLSNKQIAKTLKLSESTVKIHVSAVLKSYGVRNRTQLALAGQSNSKL